MPGGASTQSQVSLRHQCELLEPMPDAAYYGARPESAENLALMRRLDELHLEHPVQRAARQYL